jgi:PhnB protein
MDSVFINSIAPWLTVTNGQQAVEFYKAAFNAVETYRLENPDGGLVVKLAINGAEFWVSSESESLQKLPSPLGGENIKLILTNSQPDQLFEQALKAGASEVFAVGEGFGWRLGRLVDPFGLHWEIGHPLPS